MEIRELKFDPAIELAIWFYRNLSEKNVCANLRIVFKGRRGSATLDDALLCVAKYAQGHALYRLAKAISARKAAETAGHTNRKFSAFNLDLVLFHADVVYVVATGWWNFIWLSKYPIDVWYLVEERGLVRSNKTVVDVFDDVIRNFKYVEIYELEFRELIDKELILDLELLEKAYRTWSSH